MTENRPSGLEATRTTRPSEDSVRSGPNAPDDANLRA